jgi:diguanylate cyclase (GGDEF)-like protein
MEDKFSETPVGVADVEPAASSSLEAVIADQLEIIEELKSMLYEDTLTGLRNRRVLDDFLDGEIYRTRRYNRSLAFVMCDLDHFKNVNDTYGHQAGDTVLKQVGAAIKNALRASDMPFRYGGEELALILPETDGNGAMIMAERCRRLVEELVVAAEDQRIKVTISIGVAAVSYSQAITKEQLISAADAALYKAKRDGRNRCCLASWSAVPQAGCPAATQAPQGFTPGRKFVIPDQPPEWC